MSENIIKDESDEVVEQFIEDYPSDYLSGIQEISHTVHSIKVTHEKDRTICTRISETLLENGWVVCSASGKGKNQSFYYNRIDTETKEVERTITETKTVNVLKDV